MSEADIIAALRDLGTRIDTLTQGLALQQEMLATHTEMLRQILEAATQDPGNGETDPITEALQAMVKLLERLAEGQEQMLARLPPLPC